VESDHRDVANEIARLLTLDDPIHGRTHDVMIRAVKIHDGLIHGAPMIADRIRADLINVGPSGDASIRSVGISNVITVRIQKNISIPLLDVMQL
jgi:hypothetical protein